MSMLGIVLCEESVACSFGVLPSRSSSDAVNVVLNLSREIKVDDKLDIVYIEPTGGNVGCN